MAAPRYFNDPNEDLNYGADPAQLEQDAYIRALLGNEPSTAPTPLNVQQPSRFEQILEGLQGVDFGNQSRSAGGSFLAGLVGGLGNTGAARAKVRETSNEMARRLAAAKDAQNLAASQRYKSDRGRLLGDLAKEKRDAERKATENAAAAAGKETPLTPAMLKDMPWLARVGPVGTMVPKELLYKAPDKEAKADLIKVETPQGVQYLTPDQVRGKTFQKPAEPEKPMNRLEKMDLGFYESANDALKAISTPTKRPNDTVPMTLEQRIAASGLGGQFGLAAPGFLQGSDQRIYNQSRKAFGLQLLRRTSGAAISNGEYATIDRVYFVQPGDDAATIARKQQARAVALEGLRPVKGGAPDIEGWAKDNGVPVPPDRNLTGDEAVEEWAPSASGLPSRIR